MTLDPEELSAAELLVARIAANTSASAALAFSGHFLTSNFGRSLSTMEARICDGALLILARTERLAVRAQLAGILAAVESGPVRTVTHLAYDLEVEVAGPLLKRSPLIAEEDLVAIARIRPSAHLAALACRTALSPAVSAVLHARGNVSAPQARTGTGGPHGSTRRYLRRSATATATATAPERPDRSLLRRSDDGSPPEFKERRRARIERMTLRLIEGGRQKCGEPAD
jgi:uncharacterized protein (DUF2336 family)